MLAPYHARLRARARALRRHRREVHRRRGDGGLRRAGRARGRPRAGGAARRSRSATGRARRTSSQVRIGVNTGEALVALGARPAEGEGMAAGDVVNTAARLQAAAPVNGVLVGEQTYRATRRRRSSTASAEPVEAKGKAEPVPVWEALQARSRLGIDVERADGAARRPRRASSTLLVDALDARARRARAAARDARRRARDRQVAASSYELFQRVEREPELIVLAPGPLAALRRRRHASGRWRRSSRRRRGSSRATAGRRRRRSCARASSARRRRGRGATGSTATCGRSSG